jgi:hypothetical protein
MRAKCDPFFDAWRHARDEYRQTKDCLANLRILASGTLHETSTTPKISLDVVDQLKRFLPSHIVTLRKKLTVAHAAFKNAMRDADDASAELDVALEEAHMCLTCH